MSVSTFSQSRRYINTSKFQPYTCEELAAPAAYTTQIHVQLYNNIVDVKNFILKVLASNIDNQLATELKADYEYFDYLANMLTKYGVSSGLIDAYQMACEKVSKHINAYNKRARG